MRDVQERCEFRSVRSRYTWLPISGLFAIVFGGLAIDGLTHLGNDHAREVTVLTISLVGAACCITMFVNAFRAGRLTLTTERLIYSSVFRNRRLTRSDVQDAHNGDYTPWNNNRRFNVPFLVLSGGRTIRLTDLATTAGVDEPALNARIWGDEGEERSTESLAGLIEWIKSWASYRDWISDSIDSGETN
jgi:hypothetical protein